VGELRLGLIGCGAIAAWHVAAIERAALRTSIAAVVDVDADRAAALAERTGATPFVSVKEALAEDSFDACVVMVPHHLHREVAVTVLESGRHLLLEKPIASSLEDADVIVATARRHAVVFMVAENAQYWPEVLKAKALLDEGAIGEIITARSWHCAPPMAEFYGGEQPWRLSAADAGGGIAIDTGSHWIRPLRMWLGELTDVVAATARPFSSMEGESLCSALMRFESGAVATFGALLTPGAAAPVPPFQITGTGGELVVDHGRVKLYDGSGGRATILEGGNYMESYDGQIADFEAAVLDGTPPAAPPEYALGELRAALAMYRSASSGAWEPVW